MSNNKKNNRFRSGRRNFLKVAGLSAGAIAFPHIWIPRSVRAETSGFNTAKHLLYFRLSGGYRFPTGFNADVAPEFNPFGTASGVPSGASWGVSSLFQDGEWLTEDLSALGDALDRLD